MNIGIQEQAKINPPLTRGALVYGLRIVGFTEPGSIFF